MNFFNIAQFLHSMLISQRNNWCTNVVINVKPVSSCPPPKLPVETKTPANFPESEPSTHCLLVWSQSSWREIKINTSSQARIHQDLELGRHITIPSWNAKEVCVMHLERSGCGNRIRIRLPTQRNMHFLQHFFCKCLLYSMQKQN